LKAKKAILWVLQNAMEILSGLAILVCIVVTTVNALTRYLFKFTWNPGTDVVTLCFAWIVFCGAAAAYKHKMHYGFDIFVSKMPAKIRYVVRMLTHILVIVILAYATYLAFNLSTHVGGKILSNTRISYFWYDLSAVIGFGYMTLCECWHTIQTLTGKEKKEGEA